MAKKYNFLVDSHCHLDLLVQKGYDIDEIMVNAQKNEVRLLQSIATKISNFDDIYQYTQKYDNVFASIGIHPCNVLQEDLVRAEEIIAICQQYPKITAIGETGLDYYHPDFDRDKQIDSFLEHIKAARKLDLPVIIHSRDADEDMIEILQEQMKKEPFRALLHCFSSSEKLALKAIELGIYISLSGIITFKNAKDLQDIVKKLPLKYLLVETDAPYLAPMPYRGKTNQPAFTKHTAQFLADLKDISFEEICNITTSNFFELFSKCGKIYEK